MSKNYYLVDKQDGKPRTPNALAEELSLVFNYTTDDIRGVIAEWLLEYRDMLEKR